MYRLIISGSLVMYALLQFYLNNVGDSIFYIALGLYVLNGEVLLSKRRCSHEYRFTRLSRRSSKHKQRV